MYGITNSQNIIQSGGGGDTVYAVNNTGADITKGTKLWLNRRDVDTQSYSVFEYGNGNNRIFAHFVTNDDIIVFQGSYTNELIYDLETSTWNNTSLSNRSVSSYLCNIDGTTFTSDEIYGGSSNIITKQQNYTISGIYLGHGIVVQYSSLTEYKLYTVNPVTWEVNPVEVATLTFNSSNRSRASSCFYDSENKKIFLNAQKNFSIYDAESILAPTLLKNVEFDLATNYYIQYATGIGEGNYLIAQSGNGLNENKPTSEKGGLIMYQFDENYNLVEPQNLPANLLALLNQPCRIQYNNDTNILTVGTFGNIYVFRFNKETKIFEELAINFNFPTEFTQYTDTVWKCYLSNDMTTAIITTFSSSGTQQFCAYKLVNDNGTWYADRFNIKNSLTLTGFATGKTDDQGRYEVSTVLGEA